MGIDAATDVRRATTVDRDGRVLCDRAVANDREGVEALAAGHHGYAAVGVFRRKRGGYGASGRGVRGGRRTAALARFACALKIAHNTFAAGKLADPKLTKIELNTRSC